MTARYYDVVFLGVRTESLLCGALLAKRGFRVLVLGQGELASTYAVGERMLPRHPNTFLAAHSPLSKKVMAELALHQSVRRRATATDPAFQVVMPGVRYEHALDPAALERERAREFPAVKRAIEDFDRRCERHASDFDRIVERELVWPPETFFERRELARAAAHQAFDREGDGPDLLAELPEMHPFRVVLDAVVRGATHYDPDHAVALSTSRSYWAWCHAAGIEGGTAWLHEALIDKIRTYSGDVRANDAADRVLIRRGAVVGVRLAGSGDEIGCGFVAHARPVAALMPMLHDRTLLAELFERLGEPTPRWFRYTLNVGVRSEGVPRGMARDVFVVHDPQRKLGAENHLRIEVGEPDDAGVRNLCIEALLPRRGAEEVPGYVQSMRERVLDSLRALAPFLDRHLVYLDSPHDGREPHEIASKQVVPSPEPWRRGTHTMEALHGYPVRGALGICGLPVRTPVRRLLLCNDQIVPGLGAEGAFVTAASVARVVARKDRRKEWMRRGLWTKVEI